MTNNRLIFIIALGFSVLANLPRIMFLFGNDSREINGLLEISGQDTFFRFTLLFSFCFVVLKFNMIWIHRIKRKYNLMMIFLANLIILLFWAVLFNLINKYVYSINAYTLNPKLNIFVYFFFMLMLIIISRTVILIKKSKKDAVEKEILKQQSLENELEALKNQLNPHFLFNSLNSLNLLIREDQRAASTFVNKLSFMYRYILQSKHQELVSVSQELNFLESYTYLIKQRYQQNFIISIQIDEPVKEKKLPGLAIQLLLENAVKHNEISSERPLTVNVFNDDEYIIVKNNLQARTGNIESTNIGLSNLNTRCKLQMNKEIIINKDTLYFTVKIPFL